MTSTENVSLTHAQAKGWSMLASYVQSRQRLSWLWLTDELVVISICTTQGNGLSQQICWETIAFLDYAADRAYFPEMYCFQSQRASIEAASGIIDEARAAGEGDPLEAVLPILRTIPNCPL